MIVRAHRRTDCRLCGSSELDLVMPLTPTPVADDFVPASRLHEPQEAFPLDVFLCRACGLVQLLDVVDASSIYVEYLYVTKSSPGLTDHYRTYADEVIQRLSLKSGSSVVEVGSNDGTLLAFFKARGMRVIGVDPARDIARAATEQGIETRPVCFSHEVAKDLRRELGGADLLVANNVIANIDDLRELGVGIAHVLSPEGVFVFETGYLGDLVGHLVFDNIYHEHLCYHSVKPLASFFARHGMELFDIQHVGTKGGSIRGFVQRAGGPRAIAPAVAVMIAQEEAGKLYCPETYRALSARLDRLRTVLVDLLAAFRLSDRSIAGYGASHSVTTLVHHFGIAGHLGFVVDDNPRKHHLYSPGHHLPVLPSSALLERKPDYVVILPWRFSEPIINRNHAFLAAGGRFIVPIPDVRIV
jgi:SAM-dependent methyltransferase